MTAGTGSDPSGACPGGGAPLGGRAGCEQAFHALGVDAIQDPDVIRPRAVLDAWCLQHPEPYTASVKSFYVHFLGVCIAIEAPAHPRAQRAIWTDVRVPEGASKPTPPRARPAVTIDELIHADEHERPSTAQRFVQAEWERWTEHHDLASAWLVEALDRLG